MYLPTTAEEIKALDWPKPDVILVTGDTYIDSPNIGVAVIGQYLMKHGFKTAVIAQPSLGGQMDIMRLGEPALFWGVTAGSVDSMVANYTAVNKFRHQDDFTPGGVNIRPNRATIAYTNLIRQHFKNTKPIIIGGIEASLRRIAHYDFWTNTIRRSILFDAKADILAYGMAEKTIVALARALKEGADWTPIKGICYISGQPGRHEMAFPSYEDVALDKNSFRLMSGQFHRNAENSARGFYQQHGDRFLIHNPPYAPVSTAELDEIYDLDFERDAHPYYRTGKIKALETIKQSITSHRGCFGQCNFCAITVHQGRTIVSRSEESILREVERIRSKPGFNGIIYDVGGPTANMYAAVCRKEWSCKEKKCLVPDACPNLSPGHEKQMGLLRKIGGMAGVRKVFITSGIRSDLVIADKRYGSGYVEQLVRHHISGQIKLAPEHSEPDVLSLMNKPSLRSLLQFKTLFDLACQRNHKHHFMTYYLIAGHPGCTLAHMQRLKDFLTNELKAIPEQVQIFTPTPATLSSTMYYCVTDMSGNKLFCEKSPAGMQKQKNILRKPAHRKS